MKRFGLVEFLACLPIACGGQSSIQTVPAEAGPTDAGAIPDASPDADGSTTDACSGGVPGPIWARTFETSWGQCYPSGASPVGLHRCGDALCVAGNFCGTWHFDKELVSSTGGNGFWAKLTPSGDPIVVQRIGGTAPTDRVIITSMGTDPLGGSTLAGGFTGQMTFTGTDGKEVTLENPSSQELALFLLHFDPEGALAWHRPLGTAPWMSPNIRMATDHNGRTVVAASISTGLVTGNLFVASYDMGGAELFAWSTSALIAKPSGMGFDDAGNVYVVGEFDKSSLLPAGSDSGAPLPSNGSEVALFSLDSAGTYRWGRRFAAYPPQSGPALVVDQDGTLILAGSFVDSVDFSSAPSDGGPGLVSGGESDIFLARLDAGGELLWQKRFGDSDTQGLSAITTTGDGHLLLAGSSWGVLDFGGSVLTSKSSAGFVAELNKDGQLVFAVQLGNSGYVSGGGIAVGDCQTFYLAEDYQGSFSAAFTGAGAKNSGLLVTQMSR